MMLFSSLISPQVTSALAQAGLESSNLIVGIDFTKSNEWTGLLFSECLEIYLPIKTVTDLPSFVIRCKIILSEKFASCWR